MKSLREIAISSGRSELVQAPSCASSRIVCAGVFAKSGPGSRISCSGATPRESASGDALAQEGEHLGGDVAVEVRVLQAFARRGARVHQHERGAGLRAQLGQRRGRAGR